MDDIKKMIRAVINGQSAIKSELLSRISKLDGRMNKFDGRMDKLEKNMSAGFKKVNARIDKIGLQLAQLDEDAPTGGEFTALEKRVTEVEHKVASI